MIPKGFLFSAVSCGLKKGGLLDVGLIYAPLGATCAGVFTQNIVKAAPVLLGQEWVRHGRASGILVNSGCANACTGEKGLLDAQKVLAEAASLLQVEPTALLPASTGVIGARLPVEKISNGLSLLVSRLAPESYQEVAQAMMTTDTFPKVVQRQIEYKGQKGFVLGLAKGAGMIAPHMATMLAFILTDMAVPADILQVFIQDAVEYSFNRISVDGDTSTNDTVYVLASGESGLDITKEESLKDKFGQALQEVCRELAYLIVKDGEGANKLVTVKVKGSHSEKEALCLARVVSESLLVKTAIFGEDPNWGRIIAAMGRSGINFDPYSVDIYIDKIKIVENGIGLGKKAEEQAHLVMKKDEFAIIIDLKQGGGEAFMITCDLSYDYVRINAEYRT